MNTSENTQTIVDETTELPETEVPLEELPEAEVPLEELPEAEVPLQNCLRLRFPCLMFPRPATSSALWAVMSALSGSGLAALAIGKRKIRK